MCFWLLVSLLTAACCTFALKVFCVSCGFLQYVRFKQCWLAIYHLLGSVRRAAHYSACCVCVEAVAPLQLSGEAAGTLRIRAAGSNWMMRCYCAQVAELSASVWQNELSSGQSLPPTVTVQIVLFLFMMRWTLNHCTKNTITWMSLHNIFYSEVEL